MENTVRSAPHLVTAVLVALLGFLSGLTGCSTHEAGLTPKPPLSESAKAEGKFFEEVSAFYCANFRWPTSWSELQEFELSRGTAANSLDAFSEPVIQSPRAILLTLSYLDRESVRRKASFIAPPSCDPHAMRILNSRKVAMAGDGIAFALPDGFSRMKGGQIEERWKSPPFPDAAWQRDNGLLIAVRFGDLDLTDEQVADSLDDMVEAYESSVPSLLWREKTVLDISGKPLLMHEFESTSSHGRIVNVVYSGSYDGRLFAVTITGPSEATEAVLQVAREIQGTLAVR